MPERVTSATHDLAAGSTADIVISTPAQAQVVIVEATGVNGDGTGTGDTFRSVGVFDGTSQWAWAGFFDDNATSTSHLGRTTNTACLLELSAAGVTGELDFASWGASSFTLTVTDAFANATRLYFTIFSGFNNAKLLNLTRAAAGSQAYTGAGFQPNVGLFLCPFSDGLDTNQQRTYLGRGWAVSSSAQALGCIGGTFNGETSNYTQGILTTSYCAGVLTDESGTLNIRDAFTSWDTDGFTLSQTGTRAIRFCAIVLRANNPQAVTTTAQTGTGTWNVAVNGGVPVAVLGLQFGGQTASMGSASIEQPNLSWGMAGDSTQHAITHMRQNNEPLNPAVTEEYIRGDSTKFLIHYNRTGADTFTAVGEIAFSAFSQGTVTLNQTDADTTADLIPLLVFGSTAPGDGVTARGVARGMRRGVW